MFTRRSSNQAMALSLLSEKELDELTDQVACAGASAGSVQRALVAEWNDKIRDANSVSLLTAAVETATEQLLNAHAADAWSGAATAETPQQLEALANVLMAFGPGLFENVPGVLVVPMGGNRFILPDLTFNNLYSVMDRAVEALEKAEPRSPEARRMTFDPRTIMRAVNELVSLPLWKLDRDDSDKCLNFIGKLLEHPPNALLFAYGSAAQTVPLTKLDASGYVDAYWQVAYLKASLCGIFFSAYSKDKALKKHGHTLKEDSLEAKAATELAEHALPFCAAAIEAHLAQPHSPQLKRTVIEALDLLHDFVRSTHAIQLQMSEKGHWKRLRKVAFGSDEDVARAALTAVARLCEWCVPPQDNDLAPPNVMVAEALLQRGVLGDLLALAVDTPAYSVVADVHKLSRRVLALRGLAALTRLEDVRLLMAQLDDQKGEPGCSLLRAVEHVIGCGAGTLQHESEQYASELLFVISHLCWSPNWRKRITSNHTELSIISVGVRFARRLWSTHRHAIREARADDNTLLRERRIGYFSPRSHGLRTLSRCLMAVGHSIAYEKAGLDAILAHPHALDLIKTLADHPWFEVRKTVLGVLSKFVMFGHAEQLRASCTDDEARLLVASAIDAFYHEDPDHDKYEYSDQARKEVCHASTPASFYVSSCILPHMQRCCRRSCGNCRFTS